MTKLQNFVNEKLRKLGKPGSFLLTVIGLYLTGAPLAMENFEECDLGYSQFHFICLSDLDGEIQIRLPN